MIFVGCFCLCLLHFLLCLFAVEGFLMWGVLEYAVLRLIKTTLVVTHQNRE